MSLTTLAALKVDLGISGTSSRWVTKDAVVTIQFVNGKVRLKSFEKPSIK